MTAIPKVKIYHNPECGTSRNTLALIRNANIEPEVIEYLVTPPSKNELIQMIVNAGLTVREAIRKNVVPYSELELEFWFPEEDRPLTNKGSGAYPELVQGENQEDLFYGLTGALSIISSRAEEMYLQLLGNGVATEIARAVLPLNTYTEFYMSGNLKNWLDFVTKRTVPNAQIEIVEIAKQIADEIKNKFPLVWEAYERNSNA